MQQKGKDLKGQIIAHSKLPLIWKLGKAALHGLTVVKFDKPMDYNHHTYLENKR